MARKKFGIPEDVIEAIRRRDRNCAYCQKEMVDPYDKARVRDSVTIEHLNCDGPFYWKDRLAADDIVICCGSCNSSRGKKLLGEWFLSSYCVERGINAKTVAEPVRAYLLR